MQSILEDRQERDAFLKETNDQGIRVNPGRSGG